MASNKSKTPGPIQVVVVLMLSVLAFYFGNRFGQVFDFNPMEITDGALATVNSIVAAPAAISTASVPVNPFAASKANKAAREAFFERKDAEREQGKSLGAKAASARGASEKLDGQSQAAPAKDNLEH